MPSFASHDDTVLHYDLLDPHHLGGPPVLVLAGGPARHPDYLGNLGGLDRHRSLALLHQRGVGESAAGGDPGLAAWPRQAADVDALRRHLGLERIDLLGHSAGSRVAVAYAADYPGQLGRLCLVTPPAGYLVEVADDTADLIRARSAEDWYPAYAAAVIRLEDVEDPDELTELLRALAPLGWVRWDERARAHEAAAVGFPLARQAFFASEAPAGLPERLRAVTAPTLVVAGAQDAITGLAPVLAVADLFPNAAAVTIDDCGHYPFIEQPDRFREVVAGFFAP